MAETKGFPCPACGADLIFQPERQALFCDYCQNEIKLGNDEFNEIKEYPIEEAEETASRDWGDKTVVIECSGCGAQTIMGAEQTAAVCPFCGSTYVLPQGDNLSVKPESLIPFKVPREKARDKFKKWLKSRWLAPGDLKNRAKADRLSGIYIPFWTYDAMTDSFYTAEKGTYYYVTEMRMVRTSDGKSRMEPKQVRKIRWSFTSGTYDRFFDDFLVCASNPKNKHIVKKLEPFHFEELVTYQPEYLSGFSAERYSVGIKEGYEDAKKEIRSILNKEITHHIHADTVRNLKVNTSYSEVKFKHLLLPVWISAYRYKEKVFQFMVNGQTGEVQGQAPVSPWKVLGLVLLGIAVIAGFMYLFQTKG